MVLLRATRHGSPAQPTTVTHAAAHHPSAAPFGPSCGTRLCAGRLDALAIFALVSAGKRAPFSPPRTRSLRPLPGTVTTLHRINVRCTHIDNFLSIGKLQAASTGHLASHGCPTARGVLVVETGQSHIRIAEAARTRVVKDGAQLAAKASVTGQPGRLGWATAGH